MNDEYNVVIQEKSETKNLILLTINSRKNYIEKTTRFYNGTENYYEDAEIHKNYFGDENACGNSYKEKTGEFQIPEENKQMQV